MNKDQDIWVNMDLILCSLGGCMQFVPKDEVIREIIAETSKKYSFSDRLNGWKMECRIRLNGRQLDKVIFD